MSQRWTEADLGVAFSTDEAILQRVDTIAWLLLDAAGKAFLAHDVQWMERYRRFTTLCDDLLVDKPDRLDA